MEQPQQHLVNGVFAGPSQPQAGQRYAHLGDAEQASRIRQQAQRGARRSAAFLRQLLQARPPHRHQRHFRGREKAVQQHDGDQTESVEATFSFVAKLLQSSSVLLHAPAPGDQSEHSRFADRASRRPPTGTPGVRCRKPRAKSRRRFRRRPPFPATRWACRTSTRRRWQDAIFLQGFVTAQDRMWQMDALRRLAAGELAEVVGKQALESDEDARRLRLERIAEEAGADHAGRRSRRAGRVRARRELLSRNASRQSAARVHAAELRSPALERARFAARRACEMYRTLTTSWRDEIIEAAHARKGRSRQG